MRCQLSGGRRRLAYKAAAIHMCIHSIITTISCIIIRQIQVQRFFFSEGQVMTKSILRKYFLSYSLTVVAQAKDFWQMPKHLLWTV